MVGENNSGKSAINAHAFISGCFTNNNEISIWYVVSHPAVNYMLSNYFIVSSSNNLI